MYVERQLTGAAFSSNVEFESQVKDCAPRVQRTGIGVSLIDNLPHDAGFLS